MNADCVVSNAYFARSKHCAHLSAVPIALLQRGRFQFSKAARPDALATRLARGFPRRKGRSFGSQVGDEAVRNVLFPTSLRHGGVVGLCGVDVVLVGTEAQM